MASMEVTVSARLRGTWRLRLVGALLRLRVYIPGSAGWAVRGLRMQYRIGNGHWRDSDASFHLT